ncbi:hypothetical protein CF327_g7129 [Tilletia walkeri]|nr:hypothetical protein CF327_g7129 [Tilletia walkeri]
MSGTAHNPAVLPSSSCASTAPAPSADVLGKRPSDSKEEQRVVKAARTGEAQETATTYAVHLAGSVAHIGPVSGTPPTAQLPGPEIAAKQMIDAMTAEKLDLKRRLLGAEQKFVKSQEMSQKLVSAYTALRERVLKISSVPTVEEVLMYPDPWLTTVLNVILRPKSRAAEAGAAKNLSQLQLRSPAAATI